MKKDGTSRVVRARRRMYWNLSPVVVLLATRPEGPWSSALQIFTARAPSNGGTTYDAQSHPEFNVGGGQTMYVSDSRGTGTCTSEIRLVAVEFRRP